jgi:hypothetical protein
LREAGDYIEPMPTVLRRGPYRFFFYSADGAEPPHVHVARGDATAKLWLRTLTLAWNSGLRPPELRQIRRIIEIQQSQLLEAWHEFFGQ